MSESDDLAAYIVNNYGRCNIKPCICLVSHILPALSCMHWRPVTARSWDELREMYKRAYNRGVRP